MFGIPGRDVSVSSPGSSVATLANGGVSRLPSREEDANFGDRPHVTVSMSVANQFGRPGCLRGNF